MAHHARYPNLRYIAQDLATLELLLWGESERAARQADKLPLHTSHPLFVENKVRFFVDPWPWIEHLRTVDFAFGTRIHGNIAALLAGTPAYVLAHDSRTLELARYFEIPHRRITDVAPETDAAELYAEADYAGLDRRSCGAVRDVQRRTWRATACPRVRRGRGPGGLRPPGGRDRLSAGRRRRWR